MFLLGSLRACFTVHLFIAVVKPPASDRHFALVRYTTFRALMFGGGLLMVGAGVAGAALASRGNDVPSATAALATAEPADSPAREASPVAKAPSAKPSASADPPIALRPMDKALLDKLHEPLPHRADGGADAQKDAFPQQAYRVNVYQEAGHTTPNRLEVDLDRNDKWDERWTVDGPAIKREVAPAGDENFTREYALENGAWVSKK